MKNLRQEVSENPSAGLAAPDSGGSLAGQKSVKMDIWAQYFLNYSPKLENIDPSTPKPQNAYAKFCKKSPR